MSVSFGAFGGLVDSTPTPGREATMQQWEYKTLAQDLPRGAAKNGLLSANEELDKLGREGWELVHVQYTLETKEWVVMMYFLKRPLGAKSDQLADAAVLSKAVLE
jgi:hypothetical protein